PTSVNVRRSDSVFKPIPGVGASVQAAENLTIFAGVHRGFAPPRVKDAITRDGVSLELDAELSWNYEVGARWRKGGLRAEATFFSTDFENQIIPAAQSGGATTTLINAGETLHRGAEFELAADWDRLLGFHTGLLTEVRYTWLAEASFSSGIYRGNRLPYAPEHLLAVRIGWRHRGYSVHLDGSRVGDQFGDNLETVAGSADGTVGLLPAYQVWNLTASREIVRERFTLHPYVAVKNLADARYISSRAPLGIQPGMFRQVTGGIKLRF
ncbi:MAG TPA: TonB-dependent receptor, partial [Bryobacteraceae bacterium]|nr:TonB-dependent receptor [Bryobacteraceae bacterium]